MSATITQAGPGWLVEWDDEHDGPQTYYTRDRDRAERMASAVNGNGRGKQ